MTWTLILLIYVGAFTDKEAVALTNVVGFPSQAQCESAGSAAEALTRGTSKATRHLCVPVGGRP